MRLYRTRSSLDRHGRGGRRAATIGTFDGLHLGHVEILERTKRAAREASIRAAVCSFEPMPTEFFSPEDPPPRLTCFRERFELLASLGIDEMFCPRFSAIRSLSADEFIEHLLVDGLHVEHLVVGTDFRFGAGREGTLERLTDAGRALGFSVETVPPVYSHGERISSTAIRAALKAGDLDAAARMLGRDYSMSGRVVHGLGFGRDLGFPTANVNLKRWLAPIDGIFAVRVDGLGPAPLDGVASVGSRPMIGGGKTILEVHVFDFEGDIYGRYITVRFLHRLREERTFANMAAMIEQMRVDADEARAALADRMA